MAWTEEQRDQAIKAYKDANPTAANSTEIVKQIAEDMEQTSNGVRMILDKAGVYIKKEATTSAAAKTTADGKAKAPRVSKEGQIQELKDAIVAAGGEADDEVLSKLTGKAAAYFTTVIAAVLAASAE